MSSFIASVAVLDQTGAITAVNETWLRFARENGGEDSLSAVGVGVNYLEVCRQAQGEFADIAQKALLGLQAVLQGQTTLFTLNYPCPSPAGERWYQMTATRLPEELGGVVVSHLDITTSKHAQEQSLGSAVEKARAEEALRQSKETERKLREREEQLRVITDAVPGLIAEVDQEQRYQFVNAAYEKWFGRPREQIVGRTISELNGPERYEQVRPYIETVMAGEQVTFENTFTYPEGDKTVLATYVPRQGVEGQVLGFYIMVLDITERKRAERTERLLAEAGKVLASSLDYSVRLSHVAELAVPVLADWCAVTLIEEDGVTVQDVTVAHTDPDKLALAREMQRRYPARPEELAKQAQPWQRGQSELYPEITEAMLEAGAQDAEHYQFLRDLHLRSAMVVPLVARERVLGVMLFVWAESGRRYDEQDLALAEELARRAAVALDNARAYQAEQQARQEAEEAAERITGLQAVTVALSRAITPTQVARVIVQALKMTGAEAGLIALLDLPREQLERLHYFGYPSSWMANWRFLPLSEPTPLSETARSGVPLFIESAEMLRARYPELPREDLRGYEALVTLPLKLRQRTLGGIRLSFSRVRSFSEDEQAFMLTLARQCAQAIERARLYHAERQARTEAEAAQQSLALLAEIRERHRLAQELHDNVAQALGYLNLKVTLTHELLESKRLAEARANLRELKQIVGEAYTDIRGEIFNLRTAPSTEINFLETLRQYIDKYRRFYKLDIELVLEDDEAHFEFPADAAISLIRTIQEALINVRKHAQVNKALLHLSYQAGQVRIKIKDEGQGFDLPTEKVSSFGLKIMRERMESIGGRLEIESRPGKGTEVILLYQSAER
ncbi:MAG: PAS domain-containing protein [Anaerolineales bacterium]|nr:PAS domain-containing protein [Anaerolineales bacterium]